MEELNTNKRHEDFLFTVIKTSKLKGLTCKILSEHTPAVKDFRKTKLSIANEMFFVVSFEDMTDFYAEAALQ